MTINKLLLMEFDREVPATRKALERVPNVPDYVPHAKSARLGSIAPHLAQLPSFGTTILATPGLDFSSGTVKQVPFESAAQLVAVFDEGVAGLRAALAAVPEGAWEEPWKLSYAGKTLFDGNRFVAYRQMFLNHLVHHRAQLGLYLRLNDVAVPSTYGPSADEPVA